MERPSVAHRDTQTEAAAVLPATLDTAILNARYYQGRGAQTDPVERLSVVDTRSWTSQTDPAAVRSRFAQTDRLFHITQGTQTADLPVRAPSSGSEDYHSARGVGSAFDSDASLSTVGSDRLAIEDWSSSEEENAEIARLTDRLVRSDSPEGREVDYQAWSKYLEERNKPGLLTRAMRRGGTGIGWAVQRLGAHGLDSGLRLLAESGSQNFAEYATQWLGGGPTWAGRAGEYVGEGASTVLETAGVPAPLAKGAGWLVKGATRAVGRTQTVERVVSSVSDAVVGTAIGATANTLRNYISPPPRVGHGTNLYVGQPFANAMDREADVQEALEALTAPTDPRDREVVAPPETPVEPQRPKRYQTTTRSGRAVTRPKHKNEASSDENSPNPLPLSPRNGGKKGPKKGSRKGKERAE